MNQGESLDNKYCIIEFDDPTTSWRLAFPSTPDGEAVEECVFKL